MVTERPREEEPLTEEEEQIFGEFGRPDEPPPPPPPRREEPAKPREPEQLPETAESVPPDRDTLVGQSRRIAERVEKQKGIPAKITFDRLRDAPGWRERELAFLAKKTGTSKKDVDKLIEEGGGIGDKEENQGLELARATLLSKARIKPDVEPVEAPDVKESRAGERAIKVGTKTDKLGSIKLTAEIRKLAKDDPALFKILVEGGISAFNKAVATEKFIFQQESKRFRGQNTQLPPGKGEEEGEFISNAEMNRLKKESPDIHKVFVTRGFAAGNRAVEAFNAAIPKTTTTFTLVNDVFEGKTPKERTTPETVKAVWRLLTPWDETAGETYLEYMKGYPGRVKASLGEIPDVIKEQLAQRGKNVTAIVNSDVRGDLEKEFRSKQPELKQQFESQQALKKAPVWAQILLAPATPIIFDAKRNLYVPTLAGEAPLVGGRQAVKKAADDIIRTVRQKITIDSGFTGDRLSRFVIARLENPKLTPAKFRANEKILDSVDDLLSKARTQQARDAILARASKRNRLSNRDRRLLERQSTGRNRGRPAERANRVAKAAARADKWNKYLADFDKRVAATPKRQATTAEAWGMAIPGRLSHEKFLELLKPKLTPVSGVSIQNHPAHQLSTNTQTAVRQLNKLSPSQLALTTSLMSPALQRAVKTKNLTKIKQQAETELDNQIATAVIISNATQTAGQTTTQTATELENQFEGLVEQQLKQIEGTELKQSLKNKLEQIQKPELEEPKLIKPLQPVDVTAVEPPSKPPAKPPAKTPPPKRPPVKPPTGEPPPRPPKKPPKKGPPLKVPRGKGKKEKKWTPKEVASAFGFKSGFAVHAIKSPYRRGIDERSFHVDNVPSGLTIIPLHKGRGTLRSSARVISGRLKRKVTTDVGNQDIIATPHNGGRRVSIHSVRDTTGTVSRTTIKRGKSISKKSGRIFKSKVGGSEVLSRRRLRSV